MSEFHGGFSARKVFFHFDAALVADARKRALALDLSFDRLMSLAWEIGKAELFTKPSAFADQDDHEEASPLGILPACPPVVFPQELVVADIAPELAPLERSDERLKLGLSFPERALEEIRVLAVFADRSLSWCLGRAYALARRRLAATRRR